MAYWICFSLSCVEGMLQQRGCILYLVSREAKAAVKALVGPALLCLVLLLLPCGLSTYIRALLFGSYPWMSYWREATPSPDEQERIGPSGVANTSIMHAAKFYGCFFRLLPLFSFPDLSFRRWPYRANE